MSGFGCVETVSRLGDTSGPGESAQAEPATTQTPVMEHCEGSSFSVLRLSFRT